MEANEEELELSLPNEKLADHLYEIYKYYEIENDTYRAKTFLEASEKIRIYPDELISGKDAKEKIGRGIGTSTMEVIDEYLSTGTSNRFKQLRDKNVDREKVIELFKTLHGVGPVKANEFYDLGYRTFDDLWFKANLTNSMKLSIYYRNHLEQRISRKEMDAINVSFFNVFPGINFEIVGSYRREEPSSGDIDVLIKSEPNVSLSSIVNILKKYDTIVGDLTKKGESIYLGLFHLPGLNIRRLDILVIVPESWAAALMHFTGSQRFNILMRQRAIDLGLRLNQYGLFKGLAENEKFNLSTAERIPTNSERDIFDILRVNYMEPKERKKDLITLPTY